MLRERKGLEIGGRYKDAPRISTYNLTGTLDSLTLLDETIGTEQHDTDLAGLEVHAHTLDTGGEPRHPVSFPECQDFFG